MDGAKEKRLLRDVRAGDYVFDGSEYTKVIGVERGSTELEMIKLHLNDSAITLTANHLLYNEDNELIPAGDFKIGDKLLGDLMIAHIEYKQYKLPSFPLTVSGKISVNGVSASCYLFSSEFASGAHNVLAPIRFLSEHVSEYYTAILFEMMLSDLSAVYQMAPEFWNSVMNVHPIIALAEVIVFVSIMFPIFLVRQFIFAVGFDASVLEILTALVSL